MKAGESVSDLQWFLAEIDRLPDGPGTKARVVDLLCSMAGTRLHLSKRVLLRAARVREAARLLDQGAPRAVIRDRLMQRYRIGRTKAYSLLSEALTVRVRAATADGP
jgi:hypothetical protein